MAYLFKRRSDVLEIMFYTASSMTSNRALPPTGNRLGGNPRPMVAKSVKRPLYLDVPRCSIGSYKGELVNLREVVISNPASKRAYDEFLDQLTEIEKQRKRPRPLTLASRMFEFDKVKKMMARKLAFPRKVATGYLATKHHNWVGVGRQIVHYCHGHSLIN